MALYCVAVGVLLRSVASRPDLAQLLKTLSGRAEGSATLALVFVASGVFIAIAAWLATRRSGSTKRGAGVADSAAANAAQDPGMHEPPPNLAGGAAKRIEKQAAVLRKKGMVHEAAELCFEAGHMDRAADLFVEASEFRRAAEIRHDQNRFLDAAELHLRGNDHETAANILAAQGEYRQAAECYVAIKRMSVAAEMWEKSKEFRKAGDCYRKAGFDRQAAQAYITCGAWFPAAEALETVLIEETSRGGTGQNPDKEKEIQKLVLQCGKLFEQANQMGRAQAVLERGGCHAAAAEIALTRKEFARASELFQEANQPLRAAEVLKQFGEDTEAARILGEHHQAQGQAEIAAEYLEEAGDHLAAGDAYRSADQFAAAAKAYEQAGDRLQAAEMYRAADEPAHAGACFAKAGRWLEAAECFADAKELGRQAQCLEKAGRFFHAGQLFHEHGSADAAIKVLQQVPSHDAEFAEAASLLGSIFLSRGQRTLAITKLREAIGEHPLDHNNIRLYYTLATACESDGAHHEAAALYERILACDYHFEDVEPRLAAARTKMAAMPEGSNGDGGQPGNNTRTDPGRYRVLEELGRGGMGIVYKANDTVLDRVVAYKVLPDALKENPQALRNFLREAKAAAQLNHSNIVTIYDAGEQDGRYYIAMEYVDGSTLKEIVRKRGPIAAGGVMHVLMQMCEALAYALMDFGLAKVVEEVRNHTTLVSGTPYYMSPEQTLGRNVDHRTDLYSLGVTLFELCTGTLPFTEGNIPYHHVHTAPPDPRERNPKVPTLLARVILRCMSKDPGERYRAADEIQQEVRESMAKAGKPGGGTP
jgi:tetratricopeptide (TPR) repeat protein